MYKQVLIPMDGSEEAEAAIDEVLKMVPAVKAVHLALVEKPIMQAMRLDGYIVYADQLRDMRNKAGQEYLQPFREKLEAAGIEVETSVEFGEPVHALSGIARGKMVDVVLMSGQESGWLYGRRVMADIAPRLGRTLDVPVLLIEAPKKKTASESEILQGVT